MALLLCYVTRALACFQYDNRTSARRGNEAPFACATRSSKYVRAVCAPLQEAKSRAVCLLWLPMTVERA